MIAIGPWATCDVQLSGRPSRIPPYPIFLLDDPDKLGNHFVPDLGVARLDQRPEKRFHVIWPPFRSCQEQFAEPSSGICGEGSVWKRSQEGCREVFRGEGCEPGGLD